MKSVLMKKIWATAKNYGLDSSMLHELVLREFDKEHISELNDRQAENLIDIISGKINSADGITEKQKNYIVKLLSEKFSDNPKRADGYLLKYAGTTEISLLSKKSASALITGLKKI